LNYQKNTKRIGKDVQERGKEGKEEEEEKRVA